MSQVKRRSRVCGLDRRPVEPDGNMAAHATFRQRRRSGSEMSAIQTWKLEVCGLLLCSVVEMTPSK